jgi:hypothetical protein
VDPAERYLLEQILAKERKVEELEELTQKEPASRRENNVEVLQVRQRVFHSTS